MAYPVLSETKEIYMEKVSAVKKDQNIPSFWTGYGTTIKLHFVGWLYLLVCGGLNVIGVIIMMLVTNCSLSKVVNKCLFSIITIPVSFVLICLFFLYFIPSARVGLNTFVGKMLGYYSSF